MKAEIQIQSMRLAKLSGIQLSVFIFQFLKRGFFSNLHEKEPLSQTSGLSNKASFSAPPYLRQQNKPLRSHL
jgi:hypothetical protein